RVTTSAAFTGGLASEETSIQIEDGASLEVDGEFNLARRGHQATMIMDNASMVAHDWVRLAPLAPGAFPGVAEMILRNGSTLQMTAADRDLRLSEAVGPRTN